MRCEWGVSEARRPRLQSAQRDAGRAEEDARAGGQASLEPDLVADGHSNLLAALGSDALRERDRSDAARLEAEHRARPAAPRLHLQV